MKKLSEAAFERAKTFLTSKARPLETALFHFHFDGGDQQNAAVVEALKAYQNPDGGFGKALEPDVRMDTSSVVATKFALQILVDIGASAQEKLVQGAVTYLLTHFDYEKQVWSLVTAEVMKSPHAPWWNFESLEKEFDGFRANPKAGIIRCLLAYQELVSQTFLNDTLLSVLVYFETLPITMEFFDAISFLQLLQSARLEGTRKTRLLAKLRKTGNELVSREPDEWHEFAIKPLWLAPSPHAPLTGVLKDSVQQNLDFEIENQNEDGSWSPTWSWGTSDPESWAIAEKEWKGILTLATLRSLRDFGRIESEVRDRRLIYKYHID